ncbi:hypothetical protein NEF87_004705 [Candidatus Lokiarchaeum ossiferum]|uniref:Lrp/AsnC family transcriptional regulator n=1 Tax=Candidatus Lokiarchaeum ossiferum TaxID=2951803 RepID=A0ABY6HY28_9ARCH|nr:hypothetical protein NEF87_004705 [Candidatus Lokiarchaeum sp. B-35]
MEIDAKQKKVIEELFINSRVSSITLSRILQISRQSAASLRQSLWVGRKIYSPTILVNPNNFRSHNFFIFISISSFKESKLREILLEIPELTMLNVLLGEKTILTQFCVRNQKRFIEILHIFDGLIDDGMLSSYEITDSLGIFKVGGFILDDDSQINHLTERRWKLLQLLRKNYNLRKWPLTEISEQIFKIEEVKFLEKINLLREIYRFEEEGIIQNFTIILNNPIANFNTKYLVRMKPKQNTQYSSLINQLKMNPNFIEIYRTGNNLGLLGIYCCKDKLSVPEIVHSLYEEYEIQETTIDLIVEELIRSITPPTLEISKRLSFFKK